MVRTILSPMVKSIIWAMKKYIVYQMSPFLAPQMNILISEYICSGGFGQLVLAEMDIRSVDFCTAILEWVGQPF